MNNKSSNCSSNSDDSLTEPQPSPSGVNPKRSNVVEPATQTNFRRTQSDVVRMLHAQYINSKLNSTRRTARRTRRGAAAARPYLAVPPPSPVADGSQNEFDKAQEECYQGPVELSVGVLLSNKPEDMIRSVDISTFVNEAITFPSAAFDSNSIVFGIPSSDLNLFSSS